MFPLTNQSSLVPEGTTAPLTRICPCWMEISFGFPCSSRAKLRNSNRGFSFRSTVMSARIWAASASLRTRLRVLSERQCTPPMPRPMATLDASLLSSPSMVNLLETTLDKTRVIPFSDLSLPVTIALNGSPLPTGSDRSTSELLVSNRKSHLLWHVWQCCLFLASRLAGSTSCPQL